MLLVNGVYAQEGPRPTPTNVPSVSGSSDDEVRGTIQGLVYADVNGDGRCVGTGIAGEVPVPNINIEFVSSDEKTVITLYTGPDGIYGLAAAGQSYWAVTAKPDPEWIVTSEPTLYAPIFADSRAQTGINFCVQKTVGNARVNAILPQAGQSASSGLTSAAATGFLLVLTGLFLTWCEKRQHS
jgi:hypothetical protein